MQIPRRSRCQHGRAARPVRRLPALRQARDLAHGRRRRGAHAWPSGLTVQGFGSAERLRGAR